MNSVRRTRALSLLVVVGSFAAAAVAACASTRDSFDGDGDDAGSEASSSSSSGKSGSSSSGSTAPIGTTSSSGGSSSGASGVVDDAGACAAQTVAGKQLPLDIHVMLDTSGSMTEGTYADGGGPTKWDQVKSALEGFVNDAKSAGIGVGLGVFPVTNAKAPASCTQSSECSVNGMDFGKCGLHVCTPANPNDPLQPCDSPADCPGNAACRTLGQCLIGGIVGPGPLCLKDDPTYGGCDIFSSCVAYSSATCSNAACIESDYEKPVVAVAALPGNASTLTTTINNLPTPNGGTPTAGALQGGLAYLKQYKAQHPDHVAVLVLATDGFPTSCNVQDIPGVAAIASAGVNGSPSIRTFVIGVFTSDEATTAKSNLDTIADGGGTGSAFIATTGSNLTQQFQQALDTIRAQALPCEYVVPAPEAGTPDYGKVNVQFTSNGASSVIDYEKNAQGCTASGGWYYDVDPAQGGVPSKIILCPASCTAVKSGGANATIDVLLGCKTKGVQ